MKPLGERAWIGLQLACHGCSRPLRPPPPTPCPRAIGVFGGLLVTQVVLYTQCTLRTVTSIPGSLKPATLKFNNPSFHS